MVFALTLSLLPALLLGCAAGDADTTAPAEDYCDGGGAAGVALMTTMVFGRRSDDGVSLGFDLDGHVTDAGDDEGCYLADLISPDGVEGIDNGFSALIPALEATEAAAVEGLVQDAINNGELLVMLELTGVHDWENDPCVDVALSRGYGDPLIGTDGTLLPGQTLERHPDVPVSRVEGAAIVDGVLEVHGLSMALTMQILDAQVALDIQDVSVRLEAAEADAGWGYFSGGLDVAYTAGQIRELDGTEVGDLAAQLIELSADMYPDEGGACAQLSMVMEFTSTAAFFYPE